MAKSKTYEKFVEKFKPKKTTDDCYTPPLVYEAVADYVAKHYGLDKSCFVRPFYPGGDYESEDYTGKIVVDNPPFSIMSKILDFYIANGVRFFLFANHLMLFSCIRNRKATAVIVNAHITYTNGAIVSTSFVTNLETEDLVVRTSPTLVKALAEANRAEQAKTKKILPKYTYPYHVVTPARMEIYSKYGIRVTIPREECQFITRMDEQIPMGKAVYGGGLLLSDRCAAEIEKAEREKAERKKAEREKAERKNSITFHLSERELEIVKSLSKNTRK